MESEDAKTAMLPLYTYSFYEDSHDLYVTCLTTGESCVITIPSFQFKNRSSWSALPPYICFTGGYIGHRSVSSEVVMLDTKREYAVIIITPMLHARAHHNSVSHGGYLYVFSGYSPPNYLKSCERYSLANNQWETISPIPTPVSAFEVIKMENNRSVYVLGGYTGSPTDIIQELSLERLEWRQLELKLPIPTFSLPVFKVRESEFYFVIDKMLYSFVPSTSQIHQVKTLSDTIKGTSGPIYYSQGTLFYTKTAGVAKKFLVGSLSYDS